MVGINLNNTIVVDTVEERDDLVRRIKETYSKPQDNKELIDLYQKKKTHIEIKPRNS